MKRNISGFIIGISLFATQAISADEGTIHFSGRVQDQSCDLSVNGSANGDATIVLPSVPLSVFSAPGTQTGTTPFVISLKDCTPGLMVRPFFEANNVYASTGALGNTTMPSDGGARNINIAIMNDQGTQLDLNTNLIVNNPFQEIDSSGEVGFEYAAGYLAVGEVSTGKVTTALVYTIAYQ